MAGHRSPTGRARTARPVQDRGAHRAPSDGHRRVQVVAAAATLGAVAAGTVTAFASGSPAAAEPVPAAAEAGPSPVFAASAGVLQPAQRLRTLTTPAPMLPVAHVVDDEAADERVASVKKATRLAEQLGLHVGDDVTHEKFGEGVILDVIGEGDKAEAVVRFRDAGEKRLLLAWAPLQRVEPS